MAKTSALLRHEKCLIHCCGVLSLIAILVFALASVAWCTTRNGWRADTHGFWNRTQSKYIAQWAILIAGNKNHGENENQSLTPQEKNTLWPKWNRWNRMPTQERQNIQRLFDKWQHLSPAERRQLQRTLDNMNNLSPAEKEAIRRRFGN
jgi:hypothetical protein